MDTPSKPLDFGGCLTDSCTSDFWKSLVEDDKQELPGTTMKRWVVENRPPRVLLCGVFGPYGVDDEFGRKENIMELFHNQVTKAQEEASLRFHHRSFGLYFIAENIRAEATVLDFPSRRRFLREIRKDYDVVGISFITPNFLKAKEMAHRVRQYSPGSVIVLGGHGAAIEGVETLIECDHVVKGEGIAWFRQFLGQDPSAPIVHPLLPANERQSVFGVPIPGPVDSLFVPGVGCVNGCRFCSTSHFFGKTYTPFLQTGQDMFREACRIADARGTDRFFVMDENFLKDRDRAMDLLHEMEKHRRWFQFRGFSSAEAIQAFGLDNLVRLGMDLIWIGFESKDCGAYAKNAGIDARQMVRDLRDRGIAVLASGILCSEQHTAKTVKEEIDYLVSLQADLVQFMLFTALPVTQLYRDFLATGTLRENLPFEEWHGQKHLNYRHPEFPGDAPERILNLAFRQDYEVNFSSIYRTSETVVRGYRTLAAWPNRDACLEARLGQMAHKVRTYCQLLPLVVRYAVNEQEREKALALDRERRMLLGAPSPAEHWRRFGAGVCSFLWALRRRWRGDEMQPATIVTRYPAERGKGGVSDS